MDMSDFMRLPCKVAENTGLERDGNYKLPRFFESIQRDSALIPGKTSASREQQRRKGAKAQRNAMRIARFFGGIGFSPCEVLSYSV
jgi:hypothetical protein